MDKKARSEFDPEKYGMMICPFCNGNGSLQNGSESTSVCKECGGFGLVRKETKE